MAETKADVYSFHLFAVRVLLIPALQYRGDFELQRTTSRTKSSQGFVKPRTLTPAKECCPRLGTRTECSLCVAEPFPFCANSGSAGVEQIQVMTSETKTCCHPCRLQTSVRTRSTWPRQCRRPCGSTQQATADDAQKTHTSCLRCESPSTSTLVPSVVHVDGISRAASLQKIATTVTRPGKFNVFCVEKIPPKRFVFIVH